MFDDYSVGPDDSAQNPKGSGFAHFLIDMGQEHNLLWVVFIDKTRECWTFQNQDVRLQGNQTMTREFLEPGNTSKAEKAK